MTLYDKLVRDKIPAIMKNEGFHPVFRTLNDSEYPAALIAKLEEELQEFLHTPSCEEAADIQEVVDALFAYFKINKDELTQAQSDKQRRKGGFEQRVFLESDT